MKNLVWRTPGADGGRDIEGIFTSIDFSNHYQNKKWYVECKRYSSSVDWPTIWKKIAYADGRGADFLLLVTNNNPSPACESEIAAWNEKRGVVIVRVWRGYELEHILQGYPQVATKYGLNGKNIIAELSLQSLTFEVMKLNQSAYVSQEMGVSNVSSIEAGAALSELIFSRYSQIRSYGKMVTVKGESAPVYDWLSWNGSPGDWDELGIRALLTMARHLSGSASIKATNTGKKLVLLLDKPRFPIVGAGEKIYVELAGWADVEILEIKQESLTISSRG